MNRKSPWLLILALEFTCFAPVGPPMANAAEPPAEASAGASIDELRLEILRLKQTVLRLEHRISEVEMCTPDPCANREPSIKTPAGNTGFENNPAIKEPADPPTAAAAKATIQDNSGRPSFRQRWRSIERRMSAEQIKGLLGEPQQEFSVDGKTVWYYRYPDNRRGSVTFSGDMRVSGWQRPSFGGY